MLIYFEYLLTCDADELGMLEDSVEAIHALEHVHVRFAPATTNNPLLEPRFFGTRFYCKVVIPLPTRTYAQLPKTLKDGASIGIVPVVFNVGINHRASIARMLTLVEERKVFFMLKCCFLFLFLFLRLNLFTAAQVENDFNRHNLEKLKAFVHKSINYLPGTYFLVFSP